MDIQFTQYTTQKGERLRLVYCNIPGSEIRLHPSNLKCDNGEAFAAWDIAEGLRERASPGRPSYQPEIISNIFVTSLNSNFRDMKTKFSRSNDSQFFCDVITTTSSVSV